MIDEHGLNLVTIRDTLDRLEYHPAELSRFELINEGGSGSLIYRLWFDAAPLILKVSPVTSRIEVREGGYRETMFYRTLAQNLPIATPRVVASWTNEHGCSALLLGAYLPSVPATLWQPEQYIEAARQLARFHAHYWNATDALAEYNWLQQFEANSPLEYSAAVHAWEPLAERLDGIGMHQQELTTMLTHATRHLADLVKRTRAFPLTLCHGDCHIANLLRDENNHLYWADWQAVGVGYAPRDVSFFIQRAMTDGGKVPEASMFEAYHDQLEQMLDVPIESSALHQIADAFELHTRLLHWPMYLTMASDDQITTHLRRIDKILTRDYIR